MHATATSKICLPTRTTLWTRPALYAVVVASLFWISLALASIVICGNARGFLAVFRKRGVYVEAPTQDVGRVFSGQQASAKFRVYNAYLEPITLIGAQSSCGCAVVDRLPVEIPACSSRDIEFKVLVPRSTNEGSFRHVAELYMDVSAPRLVIELSGTSVQGGPQKIVPAL